jgi:signal transduction histidine kinase
MQPVTPGKTPTRLCLLDGALALLVAGEGLAELTGVIPGTSFPGNPTLTVVFVLLTAAPLVVRRAFPFTAFFVIVAVTSVWQYTLYQPDQQQSFEAFIALLLVVFGAGAYTRDRAAAAAFATVGVGSVLGVVDVLSGQPLGMAVPPMLMIIGVFLLGRLVAGYHGRAHESARRADRVERQAERERQLAVVEERARIARELHDVISHDVSLMVLQASVERRMREAGSGDASDSTGAVLESIEATGRDALAELRRMLGVLRHDDPDAPLAPQPGLAQLDDLVAEARCAGIDVELARDGSGLRFPPGLDLTAYRIVQESLTNVAKHVGPTKVRLALRSRADALEIEVVDAGAAPPRDERADAELPGAGHGLVGMRERVAMYGGTLLAGPQGNGFRVLARLPVVEAP